MPFPTPHGDKLTALLANKKLPSGDRDSVKRAIERYRRWVDALVSIEGPFDSALSKCVQLLNEYRNFLDLEVVFDSASDFLYRQKGQLNLIYEFLDLPMPYTHIVVVVKFGWRDTPAEVNNFVLTAYLIEKW